MMSSFVTFLAVISILASPISGNVMMAPKGFIKLPDIRGTVNLGTGSANKAAYDDVTNLLYIVGHNGDVMNVVDMRDSKTEPKLARTIMFDALNQGYPNDVKLCRTTGGLSRAFLAISFESKDLSERGHVHFYQPLTDPMDALIRLKTVTAVEGFDPKTMAWNKACTEVLVMSRGVPHTIQGAFEDPKPAFDILVPNFGLNVDRRTIPFSENVLKASNVRQVFSKCDSGSHTDQSSHMQDIEPTFVTVDEHDNAYILFQSNNAIGKLDLTDPFGTIMYHNLGLKDWSQLGLDTSYEDGGIKLYPHSIKSMYQPGHAVTFTLGNKTYLATADGGAIRNYAFRSGSATLCNFAESATGSAWRESFSAFMDPNMATALKSNMSSNDRTGRLPFSRLRSIQDGYNPLQMGFNYLTTYGGRGWSLLDTTDMKRVYDSGDFLEAYYLTSDATDKQLSVFNSYYYNYRSVQSQYKDRMSTAFGPNPTAIATGNVNGTQVVVVANGYMGGLYSFTVTQANNTDDAPQVDFLGFGRRGSPGLTWEESYKKDDDSVGEPGITDLLWIQDDGENVVVAISSIASVASFYSVEITS